MGWRCDGWIIGNRNGREGANENLQSNRKRRFGGNKNEASVVAQR